MLDRLLRAFLVVGGVSVACAWTWPGTFPEADPVAVLVRYHTPNVYRAAVAWYYVAPGVAVFIAGQFLLSSSRIWFARMGVSLGLRSSLPTWPLSPSADGPAIVVGEVHHPVKAIESHTPEWLTIPERGLYTGVAIFGAVGSGKTSACMHPFARQLFGWHADNPERRVAALVLEVKGDFCHDIRRMLTELDRGGDYIELSLDGRLTWNPLSAPWLDAYSLAYTVASLLNQLFGKGKEPFWQQAYTNLVRWIIELYRVLPGGWVTLRDVYHCTIDKALFAKKIEQAQSYAADLSDAWLSIAGTEMNPEQITPLKAFGFQPHPADDTRFRAPAHPAAFTYLTAHTITYQIERIESTTAMEIRLRVEAVNRWYVHDWNTLDNKIRSSIVRPPPRRFPARSSYRGRPCPVASSRPARRSCGSSRNGTCPVRTWWPWSWTARRFADAVMVIAVGITISGEKRFLGFVETDTENERVLTPFLRSLVERGLDLAQGVLVILDGGKGLRAAVRKAFRERALVHRCQWHKRENVVSYLAKSEQASWRQRLQRAYNRPAHDEALAALETLRRELEDRNQSAAGSLKEGLDETLTLHRLGLYGVLGRSLKTTNCLESINALVEERCAKVDHWQNSSQRHRWLATALLDIEPRLRKVMGYRHLPTLRAALKRQLKIDTTTSKKKAA